MAKGFRKLLVTLLVGMSFVLSGCDFLNFINFKKEATYNVSLNYSSLSMVEYSRPLELKATVKSSNDKPFDDTIVWTTSDENIATVENGYVTPLAHGNAQITASLAIKPTAKAVCNLTVKEESHENLKVSLDKKTLVLDFNGETTATLTATVTGVNKKDVTWSCEPEGIVSVENGVVTAIQKGSATVKATSIVDETKFATCMVDVVDSKFTITPTRATLDLYGEKTVTLAAYSNGVKLANIDWSSSDSTVAAINRTSAKVTGKKVGKATITGKDKADASRVATCEIEVIDTTPIAREVILSDASLALDILTAPTATLTAEVIGDEGISPEVIWSSDNFSVASVVNGVVTAKAIGTANITAESKATKGIKATCTVTVTDSNPVSITLNKTKTDLHINGSIQLTATVEHTLNKAVTWSGSENGIDVSNSGLVTTSNSAVIGASATIVATSVADPNAKASCVVTVSDSYDYTLMYYMSGSNLESESGLLSEDIKEILSVDLPSSVKVLIETGGSSKWHLTSTYITGATSISSSKLQRWEVVDGKIKLIQSMNTNHLADQNSFESFLEWGLKDYNANQMSVTISGHGGGIAGCGYDDNYSDNTLNNVEVVNAAKTALATSDKDKFTWIGYDCCIMQTADTASINADYFDYMVASQETELGTGWNHDVYLKKIANNPSITPEELLPTICTSFLSDNHPAIENYYSEMCGQTLSVLNLQKMSTFTEAFNAYTSSIGTTSSTYDKCKSAFLNCFNSFGEGVYGLADMKSFLTKLNTKFSYSTDDILSAMNNIIIHNSYCSYYDPAPCGLNVFFPESVDNRYYLQASKSDYSTSATKFTSWQKMCYTYGDWAW